MASTGVSQKILSQTNQGRQGRYANRAVGPRPNGLWAPWLSTHLYKHDTHRLRDLFDHFAQRSASIGHFANMSAVPQLTHYKKGRPFQSSLEASAEDRRKGAPYDSMFTNVSPGSRASRPR